LKNSRSQEKKRKSSGNSPKRLQQMKEATKSLNSNETSQDKSIRLKNVKLYAARKSNETSPKRASRLEKHDFESPESLNHRQQVIIKRKNLTIQTRLTINETNG
jgi:hypothetical protein